jgi:hypothetical protein
LTARVFSAPSALPGIAGAVGVFATGVVDCRETDGEDSDVDGEDKCVDAGGGVVVPTGVLVQPATVRTISAESAQARRGTGENVPRGTMGA